MVLGRRAKGQILAESAFSLLVLLSMVVVVIAASYMIAQWALVQALVPFVCEMYAESPHLQGAVVAKIPYLWLPDSEVGLPAMSIDVGGQVFTAHRGVIQFYPLENLPPSLTCTANYNIGGNFPLMPLMIARGRFSYTTTRRYGDTSHHTPYIYMGESSAEKKLAGINGGLLPFWAIYRLRRRRRGQALVEYALTSMAVLPFLVSALWAIVYCADAVYTATLGSQTLTLAALGDNRAKISVSVGDCFLTPGQPADCNGESPYSYAIHNRYSTDSTGSVVVPFPCAVIQSNLWFHTTIAVGGCQ